MSSISVAGDVSGAISIAAPSAAGSGVLTLPTGTDTLVGKATTDTLTNKTLGTGTVFPAGAVLQVVNATYATPVSSSTNVYVTTGLTATITPKFATSKILVLVNQAGCGKSTNNTYIDLMLYKGATQLALIEGEAGYNNTTAFNSVGASSTSYLDSPGTTSATTYSTQFRSHSNNASVGVQSSASTSTITLMEIAG